MFFFFVDINEQNICLEYLKDGSLFPYGCDKDDKVMLVFKCKYHVKGQKNFEDLKRCLIYWFERLERYVLLWYHKISSINFIILSIYFFHRETNGDQITIFFDMMETGLGNMDMEFTKYLISLNKLYYPSFLNYILIYEMPWVLNGTYVSWFSYVSLYSRVITDFPDADISLIFLKLLK